MTYPEDTRRAGTQPKMAWTAFVACLGAFLDGYDLVIIAGALLFIKPELHLSASEVGLVGSIVFIGMVLGALFFGRLTDRIGRSTSFVFVLLLFVVGSAVSALAPTGWVLVVGRLLVGLGIGADLPVSTTLIAEVVPADKRGMATGFMQVGWFGGAAASGLVGIGLYLLLGPQSWRWMLGSAIVLAIVVIVLRMGISESARWTKAREVAAERAAAAAAGDPRDRGIRALWMNRSVRTVLLFSSLFWFAMTVRGAGFNLYTPTFLREVGVTSFVESLSLSVGVNLIYTAAALVAVFFLDRAGRRKFALWCWGASTVLTLSLLAATGGNAVWLFVLITISALPIQGLSVAMFPLSVEAFPTLYRATGQSFSSAAGKLGGFASAFLFPVALAGLGWSGLTVGLFIFMAIVLGLGLLLRFPDPRGRELEDIEREEGLASASLG